jgi:VCBS repeat-containing protein
MFNGKKAALSVCLIAVALALSAAGCGGGSTANRPTGVAQAFLKGLIAHDAGGSYGYMSLKSEGETGMTLASWNGLMLTDPIPKTATFTVKGENIQGNTATVTITPAGGTDHPVNLSNENGSWKVDWALGEWYGLAPAL